jgi:murein DD-endopeptidase MepM/ murein hydrolase activator NlpD
VVPSRTSSLLHAHIRMLTVGALVGSLIIGMNVLPAPANQIDRIQSAQRENRGDLNDVQEELVGANKKVRKAVLAATAAQRALVRAQREKRSAKREAKRVAAVAESLRVEAAYAQSEYQLGVRAKKRIELRLASQRNDMDSVARAFYQQGPLSEIEVLLNSSSPADFTSRLVAVDYISREQQGVERSLIVTQADINRQEVQLKQLAAKADQASMKAQNQLRKASVALAKANEKQREVIKLRKAKKKAVRNAQQYAQKVKVRYQKLKKEERRLEAAAKKAVAAARNAAAQASSSSGTPSGDLVWPVPGYPKSGSVGPRIHPIYGYNSCHTGIDIGSPSGTSVKAADSGSVAAITNGGPYGRAVLLVHSGGLTTFYAHLSSESVSIGQSVSAGQEVGRIGSTGWSTGPHLHYEIRINGTPYDPMGWFGGARNPVSCAS